MVSIRGIFKRSKNESDAKSGISDRELKNWFEDGLQKGYGFSNLRDFLIIHGLKEEADRSIYIFPEEISGLHKTSTPRKRNIILLVLACIILLALVLALMFILNKGKLPWIGNIISESDNPGALINVNFSSDVGVIRGDFYGVNTGTFLRNGSIGWDIAENQINLNTSWNRQMFLASGMRYLREDAGIQNCYWVNSSNVSQWSRTCDFTNVTSEYAWAKANGVRILNILGYMPDGLADNSSGLCSDLTFCPPSNYTVWTQIQTDYINGTTNNGYYLDIIDYEEWNEPDLWQFLMGISKQHGTSASANAYIKMYNATWDIKNTYPNIRIGWQLAHPDINTNFTYSLLGNETNRMDFWDFHNYYPYDSNSVIQTINIVLSNCSTYSANCSRIIAGEYNYKNSSEVGGGMELSTSNLSRFYADIFISGLNLYPSNISLVLYKWSEINSYLDTVHYDEYPSRWSMVSEPLLDNVLYTSYNVTKNFATYHSAGSTVVKSNSSSNNIKVVASKKNNLQYITIINNGTEINVGLNIFGDTISEIKDLESGYIYNVTDGGVYIGPISQYQIRYFVILNNSASHGEELEQLYYNNPTGGWGSNTGGSQEQCNDTNLSNQTCESLGYTSGILSYGSGCTLDTSQCINNSINNSYDEENTAGIVNSSNKGSNNKNKNNTKSNQKTKIFSLAYLILFTLIAGIFVLIFYIGRILIKIKKHGTLRSHY